MFTLKVEETWRAADSIHAADAAAAAAAAAATSSWVLVHHVATRLHAKVAGGNPERPEKGRNRDLALTAWSTCKSSYIRNQGTALIRMVPSWAGGPSRITSYTTSPITTPLQDAFGQECYILWEHECTSLRGK